MLTLWAWSLVCLLAVWILRSMFDTAQRSEMSEREALDRLRYHAGPPHWRALYDDTKVVRFEQFQARKLSERRRLLANGITRRGTP